MTNEDLAKLINDKQKASHDLRQLDKNIERIDKQLPKQK